MKFPRFDYDARYLIDFSTYEHRKYQEPMPGFRIYENGIITLSHLGHRDPTFRAWLFNKIGCEAMLVSELRGQMRTAAGEKIAKAWIRSDMVLFVPQWGHLYTAGYNQGRSHGYASQGITFLHPDAQPISSKPVEVRVPNRKKAEELLDKLRPYFDLGLTLHAVESGEQWTSRDYIHERIASGVLPALGTTEGNAFALRAYRWMDVAVEFVKEHTSDRIETPYLTVD
jgi:hypothetical protein